MQLAGMVIAGGGGSSTSGGGDPAGPFEAGTDPDAVAALAAGKSVLIRKRGQYTSAGGDYVTVIDLGTIAEGKAWTLEGSWSGAVAPAGVLYQGQMGFRGTVGRAVGGSASGMDFDSDGITGNLAGQYTQLSIVGNAVAVQIKVTVAGACNYDIEFVLRQVDQPS